MYCGLVSQADTQLKWFQGYKLLKDRREAQVQAI